MLAIPTRGFALSVNTHNVDLDILCDWIEASVLFSDDDLSTTDIVDALCSAHIYRDQNLANDLASNAWTEIRRRVAWLGAAAPVVLKGPRVSRAREWDDSPAYSFCLALSLRKWYKKWAAGFGTDFTEQGSLFEDLTKEALQRLFPGWVVHQTGWTRFQPNKLAEVVKNVAICLGEPEGEVERWTKPTANEAGLDLVCYRPFTDSRVGLPVFLFQCASGGDWEGKLHTPNLRVWSRVVDFTAKPRKAFATPFAFLDPEFIRNCNLVDGLLLDRCRLLSGHDPNVAWPSAGLIDQITKWLQPRLKKLPLL